jgi:hypothetical protein
VVARARSSFNPDGSANQIEGGILQSASWTLYESVTSRYQAAIRLQAPPRRVESVLLRTV